MFHFSKISTLISLSLCLSLTTKLYSQLYINEFLTSNNSINIDDDFGQYSDWIEIYNHDTSTIHLSGYFLTDDLNNPKKWQIPQGTYIEANNYLVFWADGKNKNPGDTATLDWNEAKIININNYHVNFKLSMDEEQVGLFNPFGVQVDAFSYGKQIADVSFGRNPDNLLQLLYFGEPTPDTTNNKSGTVIPIRTSVPIFSIEGGFYKGNQTIILSTNSLTGKIRYTLDGSKPSGSATKYTNPITIDHTTIIKACVFDSNKLQSKVITNTYFIDNDASLPVISISTNYYDLWDYDFGIYKNSIKDREIPIYMEYYEPDRQGRFSIYGGMQLFGSNIYSLPQKSLAIYARSKYGSDGINYTLFNDKNIDRFKNIVLRNGGNDYANARMRDCMITSLVAGQMDIDYQAYKPCLVYLNAEYWGHYYIREKLNEHYISVNHNLNPDKLDIIEDSLKVMEGDEYHYTSLLSFIKNNDLTLSENYDFVKTQIDIDEYINYKILKVFIGYKLEDVNNKYWRPRVKGGKWRWIAFDVEHAFNGLGGDSASVNTLATVTDENGDLPKWSTFLFRSLLENDEFRNEFIQRFASYLNSVFTPDHVVKMIDSLEAQLENEMPDQINKWQNPVSMNFWKANIEILRDFAKQRPDYMRQHLIEKFNLNGTARLTINIIGNGNVFINNVPVSDTSFSGVYFKEIPVNLVAVPELGNRLDNWNGLLNNDTLSIVLTNDSIITVVFVQDSIHLLPSIIDQNMILTEGGSPYYSTGDIIVDSFVTLQVEPGVDILMIDASSIYVYGEIIMTGTEDKPIILKPNERLNARKPFYNKKPRWGALSIINATDTAKLTHVHLFSTSQGDGILNLKGTISVHTSNIILDNITVKDAFQPFYSEFGSVVIRNSNFRSDLTCDLINIKYADSALVENCILRGNDAEDTDAIDFDQINNGIIRGNKIYSFFGGNSDGIDLGENCQNILIENNQILNCSDKGISIGQASTALIRRNLIVNCMQGVGIKDSNSFAVIDQNTFYGNSYSVACFEKNAGKGGAGADVKNSILANSIKASYFIDNHSSINVSYSLSNTDSLQGEGNIFNDPLFMNPANFNFELNNNSPCIDAADPASPLDEDSSRADIGAYYKHYSTTSRQIIINEINYHPPTNYNTGDWIELYNFGNNIVDLSGWIFKDGFYGNTFIIPDSTLLGIDEFLVLCQDSSKFKMYFPEIPDYLGNFNFSLSNNEESLILFDNESNTINALTFKDDYPWPGSADGEGPTLELKDSILDNTIASNWYASYVLMGTPGQPNSIATPITDLFINEFMASNSTVAQDEFGEFDDWIELFNASDKPINIGGLYMTDDLSNPTSWKIPMNEPDLTIVPSQGFIVLWADRDTTQGALHLDFKLSKNGEQIGLIQKIEDTLSFIDSLSFGVQSADTTYGRYGNGANNWEFLYPTPGWSNILLSVDQSIQKSSINMFPNPANNFAYITIDDNNSKISSITIYNSISVKIVSESNINDSSYKINGSNFNHGIYFIKVILSNGEEYSKKLMWY